MVYIHASGFYYEVIDLNVIDATNSHCKVQMVLYKNKKGQLFVRDIDEFNEKFTKTDLKEIPEPKELAAAKCQ